MKKFALIGEKLSHSYSPEIHRAIMKKMGVKGDYSLLEVDVHEIPQVVEYIRKGRLSGINVTIPYKVEIMKYLDVITEEATAIGAVNTVTLVGDELVGHNTDYWGFRYTLEKMKVSVKDKNCVVLGGGGSARAVIKVLQDLGAVVFLVSRSPKKLGNTFDNFRDLKIIDYKELQEISGALLINTTPVGMYPKTDSCAVSKEVIDNFDQGIDLIYNPKETLFLSRCRSGENGLYMLVGQAVRAEEIWWEQNLVTFSDIYDEIQEVIYR